jgi:hypothetical protein
MTAERAHALFRAAVEELSIDPTPGNVQRYLAASHVLDRCLEAELVEVDSESKRAARVRKSADYKPALEGA